MASLENFKALTSCLKASKSTKGFRHRLFEAFPFADVDGNFARLLDSLLLRRVDGYSIVSSRCPLGDVDCNTARLFDAFLFMGDDVDIARIQLKSTKMCGGQFRSSCSRVGKRFPLELGLELG